MSVKFKRIEVFSEFTRLLALPKASAANHQPCGRISGTPFHYEVLDKNGFYWVGMAFNTNNKDINRDGADGLSSPVKSWGEKRAIKRWGDDKVVIYLMEPLDPNSFASIPDFVGAIAHRMRAWREQFG